MALGWAMFVVALVYGYNYIYWPMKRFFSLFCDALFITRPVILIPVWAYFVLGYYRAVTVFHPDNLYPLTLFGVKLNLLTGFVRHSDYYVLIMLTLSVAATYVLNQLVDLETDRKNGGLPLLAKAGISLRLAVVENVILGFAPIAYGLAVKGPILILLLGVLALNILYNVRPFYFTGRPFLDFLSNAAGFGLVAFGMGWVAALDNHWVDLGRYLREAMPYVFLMIAGSINSTIPDMEGDARTGKTTTAVLLGARNANWISSGAILIALILSINNGDFIAIITASVSIPFFARYIQTRKLKDGLHTFQICGAFLMVLTVVIFPWFFFWGLAVYVITRLYFKLRHNVDYPKAGA